jgi:uncharacterized protein YjbI with pentapeptide repeats
MILDRRCSSPFSLRSRLAVLTPQRAPVAPRVASPTTEESVRLDTVVEELRAEHATGAVMVVGEEGSGKTTSLAHLAAVLGDAGRIEFLDEPVLADALAAAADKFVVFTALDAKEIDGWTLRLLPWSRDELIEYLLAVHPDSCRPVMQRIGDYWARMPGSPLVWRIALDDLAAHPELPSVESALKQRLDDTLPTDKLKDTARQYALAVLLNLTGAAATHQRRLVKHGNSNVIALLKCGVLQLMLAAEQIVGAISARGSPALLEQHWPRELVEAVADRLKPDEPATAHLQRVVERGTKEHQPMAASVLARVIPGWRPDTRARIEGLAGAYLQGVAWDGVDLSNASLDVVDFSNARLIDAPLARASLFCAVFREATLRGAVLQNVKGEGTDFSSADLTAAAIRDARFRKARFVDAVLDRAQLQETLFGECDLTRARLHSAALHRVTFHGVVFDETDFTDADLSLAGLDKADLRTATLDGANLAGASLHEANLEDIDWPDAQLNDANLSNAHLTGSRLHNANLRNAVLYGAQLGEIDWEGADLRGADLPGVSFHMGSSRSGLLITPIASEGTRTGFYTDDCNEQHFKSPEEIRKANLCRADLRGAKIDGVDFYLVDLRGALYDPEQEALFRKCGAILDDEE